LIALAADLSERGIDFRSLTDRFDTSTASGRLLFHILASVAEMERELVKERTIAGLAAAREKGSTGGGRKLVRLTGSTRPASCSPWGRSRRGSRSCWASASRPSTGNSRQASGRPRPAPKDDA
jgi:DNA invertase Pin-like site-specific DNA recombinase